MLDISDEDAGNGEDEMSEDEVEVDIPRPASKNGIRGKGGNQDDEDDSPKKSKAKAGNDARQAPVRRPRKNPEPEDDLPETDIGSQSGYREREPETNGHQGSGSSVFDEYFELMEIAEGPEIPGMVTAGGPLDLNLVASLVRWASIAKHRVGEERLTGILELYFQSRPISGALRDLLSQITDMADALPGDDDQTAQVCVDLIAHLHGILTGGLPLGQVAQVMTPAKG
jgi:hypothetical protein